MKGDGNMEKSYDVLVIAKWLINKLYPEPLKLQKLLYLAQGYSYAFYDKPLFKEEIEGRVHGPVVPSIYGIFSSYKYNPIDATYENVELSSEALEVLNYVVENYGKYDGKYLEDLTHNQEPWIFSRKGLDSDERGARIIDKKDIANYFINDILQPDVEEWD